MNTITGPTTTYVNKEEILTNFQKDANSLYKRVQECTRENFWMKMSKEDFLDEPEIKEGRIQMLQFCAEEVTDNFVDYAIDLVGRQADVKAHRTNWKLQRDAIEEGTNLEEAARDQEKWFNRDTIPQPILTSELVNQLESEEVKNKVLSEIEDKIQETRGQFAALEKEMKQYIAGDFTFSVNSMTTKG